MRGAFEPDRSCQNFGAVAMAQQSATRSVSSVPPSIHHTAWAHLRERRLVCLKCGNRNANRLTIAMAPR